MLYKLGKGISIPNFKCYGLKLFFSTTRDLERLSHSTSSISRYWLEKLNCLEKSNSINLIKHLVSSNALGYISAKGLEAKKGTMLHYIIEEKNKHLDKILLVRCGDFYETYGVDAIMLVEHAGLNPMGGRPKAGCPISNIQQTLDKLIDAGFVVAVYEESSPVSSSKPVTEVNSASSLSTTTSKLKNRYLSQIVSSSQSNYLYGACLKPGDIEFREGVTGHGVLGEVYVGINHTPHGYSLSCIDIMNKTVRTWSRLNSEGVRSVLRYYSVAHPVYVQNIEKKALLEMIPREFEWKSGDIDESDTLVSRLSGFSELVFVNIVCQKIGIALSLSSKELNLLLSYHNNAMQNREISGKSSRLKLNYMPPRPIYISTALQIGLMQNENVPDLLYHLLNEGTSDSVTKSTGAIYQESKYNSLHKKFLHEWLMCPPPLGIANYMRILCFSISKLSSDQENKLPQFYEDGKLLSVGKITNLLLYNQCNSSAFQQLLENVTAVQQMCGSGDMMDLTSLNNEHAMKLSLLETIVTKDRVLSYICCALIPLIEHYFHFPYRNASGENTVIVWNEDRTVNILQSLSRLQKACERMRFIIANTLPQSIIEDSFSVDKFAFIPKEFFHANEEGFRGRVNPQHVGVHTQYIEVQRCADALITIVRDELGGFADGIDVLKYDMINNSLYVNANVVKKAKSTEELDGMTVERSGGTVHFISCMDKRGVSLGPTRLTTNKISIAVVNYLRACEVATEGVVDVYKNLCEELFKDIEAIQVVVTWNLILSAILRHVYVAKRKNWTLPDRVVAIENVNSDNAGKSIGVFSALQLLNLVPFWMNNKINAVQNDVFMDGLFLMTGPNMSGKSTLMRSILTASLLGNSGLYMPCVVKTSEKPNVLPFFTNYFMRTSSYDVPSSNQSAFALEMDDLRVLVNDCCNATDRFSQRSLVMIDEIGKGTSSKDGASLAGAILEYISAYNVMGVFATHLHEVFQLPLCLNEPLDGSSSMLVEDEMKLPQLYVRKKKMLMEWVNASHSSPKNCLVPMWRYKLIDGVCTDSHALLTASQYRLPEILITRAVELQDKFDNGNENFKPEKGVFSESNKGSPTKLWDAVCCSLEFLYRGNDSGASLLLLNKLMKDDAVPPSLSASHCAYVLELTPISTLNSNEALKVYYVGETADLKKRLAQHRKRFNSYVIESVLVFRNGNENDGTILGKYTLNKSSAKLLETCIILKTKEYGLNVINSKLEEGRIAF